VLVSGLFLGIYNSNVSEMGIVWYHTVYLDEQTQLYRSIFIQLFQV
jgi:hypothetical protein